MKRQLRYFVILMGLLVLAPGWARAAEITVDANGACTLADAITAANTDTATGGCSAGSKEDVVVILETDVLLDAALPVVISTITIEGQGHAIDGNDDPIVGSVFRVSIDGALTLNNITVTGGNNSIGGGGIYNEGGLVLTNAKVNDNAVSCDEGILSAGGGGILSSGSLVMTDSMVIGNSVSCDHGEAVFGGGIVNMSSLAPATITNSIISGNSLSCNNCMIDEVLTGVFLGGGIVNIGEDSELILNRSTVSNNSVFAFGAVDQQNILMPIALGGGIMNYGADSASVRLTNSTVSGNAVLCDSCILSGYFNYGGGIASWEDDDAAPEDVEVTLVNSTITGNSVVGSGGGIGLWGGTARLMGSIVSGNLGSEIIGSVASGSANLIGHSG